MRSRNLMHKLVLTATCLLLSSTLGCSGFRPIKGVPVDTYPDDMRGALRSGKETIDLSLLGQRPAPHYYLDSGDVLGVYIEGVLGKREEVPPVYFPQNGENPPSLGYPIPVREDGTISLPLAGTLTMRGLTVRQAEERIRKAYVVDQPILQPGRDRILVSLQRPRTYNVLVVRQEAGSGELGMTSGNVGTVTLGMTKRGTGKMVALQAYKNDVLHALTDTGGLPGLDAENTIYVIRRRGGGASGSTPPFMSQPGFDNPAGPPTQIGPQIDLRQGPPTPAVKPPVTPTRFPTSRKKGDGLIKLVSGRYEAPRWQAQQTGLGSRYGRPTRNPFQPAVLNNSVPAAVRPAQHELPPSPDPGPQGLMPPESANAYVPQGPAPTYGPPVQDYAPAYGLPQQGPAPTIGPPLERSAPPYGPPLPGPGSNYGPPMQEPIPDYGPQMQGAAPTIGPPQQGSAGPQSHPAFSQLSPQDLACMNNVLQRFGRDSQIIRIPVRLHPGEPLNITEQDVILQDGDIVFIESRETEIFYTGGLLGGGQYVLPRDYDLDVLGAVSIASGRQQTGGGTGWGSHIGGVSSLNQDISVGASDVIVLRKLPGGGQVPIHVDLNKAVRDPSQRIRILPGDYVILQYKCHEAIAAFVERNLLAGGLISLAAVGGTVGGGR